MNGFPHRHINPRRCSRGMSNLFSPANAGLVGLFNDSSSAQLIKVWSAASRGDAGAELYNLSVQQARLTSHDNGFVTPVVTGDPRGPGRVDTQDGIIPTAIDYSLFIPSGAITSLFLQAPLCVLLPGWSLIMSSLSGVAATIGGFFYWEWCFPQDLISPTIGDPTVDEEL